MICNIYRLLVGFLNGFCTLNYSSNNKKVYYYFLGFFFFLLFCIASFVFPTSCNTILLLQTYFMLLQSVS